MTDFNFHLLANTKYDTDSSPDSSESDELESKESKKRLLGASKCTFGPSYWCSSKETMLECNVSEQHCC